MIHVCFCFRDKTGRYAKFAGTTALSVFENLSKTPPQVTIHILHDNTLTGENIEKFSYLAGRYNQFVKFYNVEKICPKKIKEISKLIPEADTSRVTVGAFYKLLIPQILPKEIEKVILLEPDMIVNLDINELWRIELGDKALAAVTESENGTDSKKSFLLCSEGTVNSEEYFNTGVMLMNLNVLRKEEETITQGILFRAKNPKQKFFEQTVLNYCFSSRMIKLPLKFNRFVKQERASNAKTAGRKIYHYSGGALKLDPNPDDPFNQLWMKYFIKSPWLDEDALGRLCVHFEKICNDLKERALKMAAIISGKSRAFFIEPSNVKKMIEVFSIRSDEEIIFAENEDSIKKLINAMKESEGKSLFFIMTEKIGKKKFSFDKLTDEGFVQDKDFVKGWTFLSDKHGIPFNSFSLIESM